MARETQYREATRSPNSSVPTLLFHTQNLPMNFSDFLPRSLQHPDIHVLAVNITNQNVTIVPGCHPSLPNPGGAGTKTAARGG